MKTILLAILLFATLPTVAAITETKVEYKEGDQVLEGWVVRDTAKKGKLPGVIVVHDWKGVGAHAKAQAKRVAELGLVAFIADIYGQGVRPKDNTEAKTLAGKYKNDRVLLRKRALAALEALRAQKNVDIKRVAAIGYCFGGTTVLELARSGADVNAVVSFHGGLSTPNTTEVINVKAKVLVLHGGDDPGVPDSEVTAFKEEMRKANVAWELVAYGGAVHSFTNPEAGNDNSKGAAYNKTADQRSFEAMKDFFKEVL
ncbi:MAG: dienelactone hydrolase family protein [Bdellovibrionia bacterium]